MIRYSVMHQKNVPRFFSYIQLTEPSSLLHFTILAMNGLRHFDKPAPHSISRFPHCFDRCLFCLLIQHWVPLQLFRIGASFPRFAPTIGCCLLWLTSFAAGHPYAKTLCREKKNGTMSQRERVYMRQWSTFPTCWQSHLPYLEPCAGFFKSGRDLKFSRSRIYPKMSYLLPLNGRITNESVEPAMS